MCVWGGGGGVVVISVRGDMMHGWRKGFNQLGVGERISKCGRVGLV